MATNDKLIVGGSAAIRDGYTTETLSLMAMMNSDNDDGHEDDEDDDGDDDDNDDNDQHMDRGRFGSEQVRVHHRNSLPYGDDDDDETPIFLFFSCFPFKAFLQSSGSQVSWRNGHHAPKVISQTTPRSASRGPSAA